MLVAGCVKFGPPFNTFGGWYKKEHNSWNVSALSNSQKKTHTQFFFILIALTWQCTYIIKYWCQSFLQIFSVTVRTLSKMYTKSQSPSLSGPFTNIDCIDKLNSKNQSWNRKPKPPQSVVRKSGYIFKVKITSGIIIIIMGRLAALCRLPQSRGYTAISIL